MESESLSKSKESIRESIYSGTELHAPFMFMNMLAATIASYGLFANSPAVIIGAMIIAMLLGPIAGISLALVDNSTKYLLKGLLTLLAGAAGVIATALTIGMIHYDLPITGEMLARTTPNFSDLMIALAGGAAGAYATVSPRLSVAFVGVAIATALVPPLCSASILLARGYYSLAFGAFLLTFTNIVAIQFSSSVVLWFTGFRSISHTKGLSAVAFLKANSVSIIILAILAVVLTNSMHVAISKKLFETSTKYALQQECITSEGCYLADVRFDESKNKQTIVIAVVRGPNPPTAERIAAVEKKLPSHPRGNPIELRVRYVPTTTISRAGVLFDDDIETGSEK